MIILRKINRMFAFLILWLTCSSCFIAFIRFSYNTLRLKHVRIEMTSLTRAKKLCSRDQWWLLGIHVYIREMYASSRLLTYQASVILWTVSFSHVKARGHTLTRWQVTCLLRHFESLSLPTWNTNTHLKFYSLIYLGISWKDLVSTEDSLPNGVMWPKFVYLFAIFRRASSVQHQSWFKLGPV